MTRKLLSATLAVALVLGTCPGLVLADSSSGRQLPNQAPAAQPTGQPVSQPATSVGTILQQILQLLALIQQQLTAAQGGPSSSGASSSGASSSGNLASAGTPSNPTGGTSTSTGAPPGSVAPAGTPAATSPAPATPAAAAPSPLQAVLGTLQQVLGGLGGNNNPAAGSAGGSGANTQGSSSPLGAALGQLLGGSSGTQGSGTPTGGQGTPSSPVTSDTSKTRTPGGQAVDLNQSDTDMLCHLVQSEVPDNAPFEGKVAVAAVVLNRVKEKFQGSVSAVITAKYQFSGVKTAQFHTPIKADTLKAVQAAQGGQDPSKGATFYYNPYLVSPPWANTMHETAKIGTTRSTTHRFMHPEKVGGK